MISSQLFVISITLRAAVPCFLFALPWGKGSMLNKLRLFFSCLLFFSIIFI